MHYINHTCTNIDQAGCVVADTIYGYYPSLPFNGGFLAFFSLVTLIQLVFAWRYKLWFYGLAMAIGAISEAVGYASRVQLHSNPFDKGAFTIQITMLI